jgi:hypothetical protein
MHYKWILEPNQIYITDWIQNIETAMQKLESDPTIKFFDLLSCTGWCIWWPGIFNKQISIADRTEKIKSYQKHAKNTKIWDHLGKAENINIIDFSNKFL